MTSTKTVAAACVKEVSQTSLHLKEDVELKLGAIQWTVRAQVFWSSKAERGKGRGRGGQKKK